MHSIFTYTVCLFPSRPDPRGRGQRSADLRCGRQQDDAGRVGHAPSVPPTGPQTQSPGHRTRPACEYRGPHSRSGCVYGSRCTHETFPNLISLHTPVDVRTTNTLSLCPPSLLSSRWELWTSSSRRAPRMCPSSWRRPVWICPQRKPSAR